MVFNLIFIILYNQKIINVKLTISRLLYLSRRQIVVSIPRLSAQSCHLFGQNQCYGNILLNKTSVISIMVSHFNYKHRCLVEKNAPIALILPSRWQDGAESLGIERTSCLCLSQLSWAHQALGGLIYYKTHLTFSWFRNAPKCLAWWPSRRTAPTSSASSGTCRWRNTWPRCTSTSPATRFRCV